VLQKMFQGEYTVTVRKPWLLILLFCLFTLSACGTQGMQETTPPSLLANGLHLSQKPAKTEAQLNIEKQQPVAKATSTSPQTTTIAPTPPVKTTDTGVLPPNKIPVTGAGVSPYGSPSAMTALEIQLTQKLFAQINSDRAAQGLYSYTWNETLAGGARLHSWDMYHCGFSHTCPDGQPQCTRIASEGFAGVSDCGENIAYAGPFPTAWEGTYKIQEGMVNEPPSGWHRIHLFSTTLHRLGVGVFVDPQGYIWFTEDMVS
jgi:uncharacterized protein YkwD